MTLWTFVTGEPIFGVITFLIMLLALYGVFSIALGLYCKFRLKRDKEYQPQNWISYIVEDKQGHSIILFLLAIMLFVYFVIFVFANYWGQGVLSDEIGDWGAVGDYFGGLLNPILAFASFMALLYTIRIQSEELRLTRLELSASRLAQERSSDALDGQLQNLKVQQFEATFFKVLDSMSQHCYQVELNIESVKSKVLSPVYVSSDDHGQVITIPTIFIGADRWEEARSTLIGLESSRFYALMNVIRSLLNFLCKSESDLSLKPYFYIEQILNALTPDMLRLLIVWCSNKEESDLKGLVEKYHFFASLRLSKHDSIGHGLPICELDLDIKAFELSKEL